MVNEQMVQLITGPVCLTIVAFFSTPALRGLAERAEGVEKLAKLYEDKDGTATEESEGNRSDAAPAIVIFSGTAVGLVSSVFWVAVNRKESGISASSLALSGAWSEFGTWVGNG